jgi:hypothetical protein
MIFPAGLIGGTGSRTRADPCPLYTTVNAGPLPSGSCQRERAPKTPTGSRSPPCFQANQGKRVRLLFSQRAAQSHTRRAGCSGCSEGSGRYRATRGGMVERGGGRRSGRGRVARVTAGQEQQGRHECERLGHGFTSRTEKELRGRREVPFGAGPRKATQARNSAGQRARDWAILTRRSDQLGPSVHDEFSPFSDASGLSCSSFGRAAPRTRPPRPSAAADPR